MDENVAEGRRRIDFGEKPMSVSRVWDAQRKSPESPHILDLPQDSVPPENSIPHVIYQPDTRLNRSNCVICFPPFSTPKPEAIRIPKNSKFQNRSIDDHQNASKQHQTRFGFDVDQNGVCSKRQASQTVFSVDKKKTKPKKKREFNSKIKQVAPNGVHWNWKWMDSLISDSVGATRLPSHLGRNTMGHHSIWRSMPHNRLPPQDLRLIAVGISASSAVWICIRFSLAASNPKTIFIDRMFAINWLSLWLNDLIGHLNVFGIFFLEKNQHSFRPIAQVHNRPFRHAYPRQITNFSTRIAPAMTNTPETVPAISSANGHCCAEYSSRDPKQTSQSKRNMPRRCLPCLSRASKSVDVCFDFAIEGSLNPSSRCCRQQWSIILERICIETQPSHNPFVDTTRIRELAPRHPAHHRHQTNHFTSARVLD